MSSPWRLAARQAIQSAIKSVPDGDLKKLKAAIDAAFPLGYRKYYPYKIWLDERRKYFYILGILQPQPDKLGRRTKKPGCGCDRPSPGQLSLW